MSDVLCIAWAPHSPRLHEFAETLNAEEFYLSFFFRKMFLAPLRYFFMGIITIFRIFLSRSKVVIVQNPPIFAPIAAWIACRVSGRKLIVDHHCVWAEKNIHFPIIHQFIYLMEDLVSKHTDLNLSPHEGWSKIVKKSGGKVLTHIDKCMPSKFSTRDDAQKNRLVLISPSGGDSEERIDLCINAVKQISWAELIVPGYPNLLKNYIKLAKNIENVKFPGFLKGSLYLRLFHESDIALNVTDEKHTIPHFIYEALALNVPMISTYLPELEQLFGDSVIYLKDNSVNQIILAIKKLRPANTRKLYRKKLVKRCREIRSIYDKQNKELRGVIDSWIKD